MKKRKTSKSKNNLNQEDLHRSVISKEINLGYFLKIIQIPHVRRYIKS